MNQFNPSTRRLLKSALALGAGAGAASLPVLTQAQGKAPVSGTEYKAVDPAQPTDAPGKVEVIEFFWLGCPHCAALEPSLEEWVKQQKPDVAFQRVHVPFNEVNHQHLYYTIVALGRGEELVPKVFHAIQVERNYLNTKDKIGEWLGKNGVDKKAFDDAWGSFSVQTGMRRATALASAYKVDSVPQLAINGKYITAPSMAGSNAAALQVADYLIDRERKGAHS